MSRINVSEVHRVYQILEDADNLRFMTMLDATSQKNATTAAQNQTVASDANVYENNNESQEKTEQNHVLIKTETRTGYVNIDGTERETVDNESVLKEVQERVVENSSDEGLIEPENIIQEGESKVEVDDIIVAQLPEDDITLPSTSRTKDAFKLLPKVIQDFLNNDWKTKPKCEPQRLLERIRKENRYPDHPDAEKYELLLTPVPSFLQRISLAGEFLSKKHLEL